MPKPQERAAIEETIFNAREGITKSAVSILSTYQNSNKPVPPELANLSILLKNMQNGDADGMDQRLDALIEASRKYKEKNESVFHRILRFLHLVDEEPAKQEVETLLDQLETLKEGILSRNMLEPDPTEYERENEQKPEPSRSRQMENTVSKGMQASRGTANAAARTDAQVNSFGSRTAEKEDQPQPEVQLRTSQMSMQPSPQMQRAPENSAPTMRAAQLNVRLSMPGQKNANGFSAQHVIDFTISAQQPKKAAAPAAAETVKKEQEFTMQEQPAFRRSFEAAPQQEVKPENQEDISVKQPEVTNRPENGPVKSEEPSHPENDPKQPNEQKEEETEKNAENNAENKDDPIEETEKEASEEIKKEAPVEQKSERETAKPNTDSNQKASSSLYDMWNVPRPEKTKEKTENNGKIETKGEPAVFAINTEEKPVRTEPVDEMADEKTRVQRRQAHIAREYLTLNEYQDLCDRYSSIKKVDGKDEKIHSLDSNEIDLLKILNEKVKEDYGANSRQAKYMEHRITCLENIENLKKTAEDTFRKQPGADLEIKKEGQAIRYMLKDVSQASMQQTNHGCWSVALASLLGQKGVKLDQETIRAYRPDKSYGDQEDILACSSDAKGNSLDLYRDLIMDIVPDTAMTKADYILTKSNPTAKDEADYRAAAKKSLNDIIRKAVIEDQAALAFNAAGHYLTVCGAEQDEKGEITNVYFFDPLKQGIQPYTLDAFLNQSLAKKTQPASITYRFDAYWLHNLTNDKGKLKLNDELESCMADVLSYENDELKIGKKFVDLGTGSCNYVTRAYGGCSYTTYLPETLHRYEKIYRKEEDKNLNQKKTEAAVMKNSQEKENKKPVENSKKNEKENAAGTKIEKTDKSSGTEKKEKKGEKKEKKDGRKIKDTVTKTGKSSDPEKTSANQNRKEKSIISNPKKNAGLFTIDPKLAALEKSELQKFLSEKLESNKEKQAKSRNFSTGSKETKRNSFQR